MNKRLESEHGWIKLLLLLFWLVLILAIVGAKTSSPGTYQYFISEDSLSEYAQSGFYLLSAVFAMLIAYRALQNGLNLLGILYGVLASGLFFVSMEEISWGQRIFGIANPDYFAERNVQGELTLHNLDYVQPLLRHIYIAIGFYGSFAWVLAALLDSKLTLRRGTNVANFLIPPWYVAPYFFVCFCIYTFLHYIRPDFIDTEFGRSLGNEFWFFLHWREEEHAELFLSLGFLFFTILGYRKLQRCLQSSR